MLVFLEGYPGVSEHSAEVLKKALGRVTHFSRLRDNPSLAFAHIPKLLCMGAFLLQAGTQEFIFEAPYPVP